MEIRYVDSALANNFGTYIELNKNLRSYPELHDAILQHELSHTDKSGLTKEDLLLDIRPTNISYLELLGFMLKYPRSLLQLLPVYIKDKKIVYDLNMILIYTVSISIVGLAIFLSLL